MKRFSLILVALFLCGAMAPRENYRLIKTEKVNNVGLDAASTAFTHTDVSQSGRWGLMMVFIQVTDADNSCTALNMSCTASFDDNTTDYAMQDCTTASGVHTCLDESWTKNPTAITSPKKWVWRVNIEGFEDIECTFTDTGGAAADKLDVTIAFSTKG